MKKLFAIFSVFIFSFAYPQNEEAEISKTVNDFFNAMKEANPVNLKETLTDTVILQTISKEGKVKMENAANFVAEIANFSFGDLHEKITVESVLTDGTLANVWMSYEFFIKGKISHCGVNSFQLVKQNNSWKIQNIIDTRRKCAIK